jgi:hypothetical protein
MFISIMIDEDIQTNTALQEAEQKWIAETF